MKLDDLKQSNRVEDRRGQSGSSYGGGSSGGNGMGGLLVQLLFSRGKGKWIIIAILLLSFFAGGGQLGDFIGLNSYQSSYEKITRLQRFPMKMPSSSVKSLLQQKNFGPRNLKKKA